MKAFSIILTGNGKQLCLLTKNGVIPKGDILAETGISLKKRDFLFKNTLGVRFYYVKYPHKPINGWQWIPLISLERLENNFGALLCEALGKFWKVMPDSNKKLEIIKLPPLFKKKDLYKDVIFFPGSFNPWHKGHLECLKLCPNKSKIIVVPDSNPWKTPVGNSRFCKWEKYRNLCLLLKNKPCSIYPGFLGLERSNPTITWFPKTKVKKKNLLMGDDSFLSLTNWKDFKKLISSIHKIYVVPRMGREEELRTEKGRLLSINPKLKIKFLPTHKYQKISSTKIRGD